MRYVLRQITALFLMAICVSCATTTENNLGLSLDEITENEAVLSFPYQIYGNGVWMIEANINGSDPLPFIVDTGATRSAIFDNFLSSFALSESAIPTVNVYGMTGQERKTTTRVPLFQFGDKIVVDYEFVVLRERDQLEEPTVKPVGLIGMDLLRHYHIHADASRKRINLIPLDFESVKIPRTWRAIELKPNPFSADDRGLHFMDMRIGNTLVTALFDSGSEINAVKWEAINNPLIKDAKKRLYKAWTIQGATGEFDPVSFLTAQNFRSGQKHWKKRRFYLMNLTNLNILGIEDEPFAIAGGNLFSDTSVYVDFEQNIMWVKPEKYDLELMRGTGVDIVIRSGPATRN